MEGVILLKNKKSYILISQNVAFNLVPVVGVEPTRYRYHWILSYLLHTEYKRTQPRMEVIDGHQSACNYWLF